MLLHSADAELTSCTCSSSRVALGLCPGAALRSPRSSSGLQPHAECRDGVCESVVKSDGKGANDHGNTRSAAFKIRYMLDTILKDHQKINSNNPD